MIWAFLNQEIYHNSPQEWLVALGIAVGIFLLLQIAIWIADKRLSAVAQKNKTGADDLVIDLIRKTGVSFRLVLALFAGSKILELDFQYVQFIRMVTIIALSIQSGLWANRLIQYGISLKISEQIQEDAEKASSFNFLRVVLKVVLWTIVLLLILENIPGIEVTALIASLGIGGIAIGLALQNILVDLFASLSIALDKPFVIGDFIMVGEMGGSVEYIGLRSTRLRSPTGEQLVIGNSDLLSNRIRNYKQMNKRRVIEQFGVVYQTPAEKLRLIPGIVGDIVISQPDTTLERAHFKGLGDFSLLFEYVYNLESIDFKTFRDVQEDINLRLIETFASEGIEFAYPTQTLIIENGQGQKQADIRGG